MGGAVTGLRAIGMDGEGQCAYNLNYTFGRCVMLMNSIACC